MMKRKYGSNNFISQVIGLLLLWCLALYTIYQIRTISFETLHIPSSDVAQRLIIYQASEQSHPDFSNIYKNMANLPMDYWDKNKKQLNLKNSCATFPNPSAVEFHQTYWQSLYTSNVIVRILNAYLDTRKENPNTATVRILTMVGNEGTMPSIYCQLWFEGETEPVTVKSYNNTKLWHSENSEALPYLINCRLPNEYIHLSPITVSLVENPCDNALNILKINYNKYATKKDFGICVKGLNIPSTDLSDKFIEWIELVRILGADKVFFYDLGLHPQTKVILNQYEKEGKIQVSELKLAESSYELTKMQKEVIPYTDCFYKHMYEFKYIVILDMDEILLPLKNSTWKSLLVSNNTLTTDQTALYTVKSLNFVDLNVSLNGIPSFMNMLQNIYRSNKPVELSVKALFNTDKMLTLHNDLPVICLNHCLSHDIEMDEAQLQHYHEDCALGVKKGCADFKNGTVVDKSIWNFKEVLLQRVQEIRKNLALYNE